MGCLFDTKEKWEYIGDTVVDGKLAKHIFVTRKSLFPPSMFFTSYLHHYFYVSNDSVEIFMPSDTSWQLLYDFSLQIGDTTHSPLKNSFGFGLNCDSSLYQAPALVTDTGTVIVAGVPLKFYTVQYFVDPDSNTATYTYYERLVSYEYWYPYDQYYCGLLNECTPYSLICYKDNDMMTDSSCSDFSWFETLSINEIVEEDFNLYPNPVTDLLMVQTNLLPPNYYDIISMEGKLIVSKVQSPVNVSTLPPGIYFLANQNRTVYRKFIKT